jgi:hypothetical protein
MGAAARAWERDFLALPPPNEQAAVREGVAMPGDQATEADQSGDAATEAERIERLVRVLELGMRG